MNRRKSLTRSISIHAPPRGATTGSEPVFNAFYFNSRPSARGDHPARRRTPCSCYFNSRPSARGDSEGGCALCCNQISIHAPPRGATGVLAREIICAEISIHAPPRGATWRMQSGSLLMNDFNSRPSARGDVARSLRESSFVLFQFTPLREGRRKRVTFPYDKEYFNSRPSARGDRLSSADGSSDDISIHAPPRGATRGCHQPQKSCIFQFTPLREGRPRSVLRVHGGFDFNSRPSARGDWLNAEMDDEEIKISIHAPPRGATVAIG